MEPQTPGLSDVTDGHVGETSDIAAVDDIEWNQDGNAEKRASSKEYTRKLKGTVIMLVIVLICVEKERRETTGSI